MTQEFGSFAKEVALHLEINPNTLRRWSMEPEKEGYEFTRNDKNQRIYYQRDILAFTDFKKMIEKTQSLETAAKAIAKQVKDRENADKMLSVIKDNDDKIAFTKEELEKISKRTAEETALRTSEYLIQKMNDSVERRDRELMQQIDERMNQKSLEIAATEEKATGSWSSRLSRWFGKKKD